ncbi:MAG: flagellar hook-associated protein FlgL [Deltaproteobacteria bacterium]|nr:flagellar hook-associated protein FlgL [Deltaproteobacteria bacterium]
MRVSNRFLYYQLVKDISESTEKMFKLNGQISSGSRIDKPSEDPIGLSRVLIYRSELNSFDQFEKSIDQAKNWLSRMDAILMDADDLLARASELAVQQSSATATASTREGAAQEIREIRNTMLSLANSKYANKYMFGGTMTQNLPFLSMDVQNWQTDVDTMAADNAGAVANLGGAASAGDRYINTTDGNIYEYDGAVWQVSTAASEGISAIVGDQNELYVYSDGAWLSQYQGNSSTYSVKIGKSDIVETNIPGNEIFNNDTGDVLMTLMRLEKALRSNDQQGISDELPEIENSSKILMNKLAGIGAKVNRFDQSKSILERAEVDTKESTSLIEDLDYAEAITSLQNQQTIYEATLKSASMITGLSLVNYV